MARRLTTDLKSETIEIFSKFNATELSDDWVRNVWDNHFTDIEREPENYDELFPDYDWVDLFQRASTICRMWAEKKNTDEDDVDTNCGFWIALVDNNISYKSILALTAYLISKGGDCNFKEYQVSIFASNFYLNLLCVPGSSAFKLFNSILFQSSIKLLRLPLKIASRSRKRSGNDKGNKKGNKRRKADQNEMDVDDIPDSQDSDNPFKDLSEFDKMSTAEIETLIVNINMFMNDLIYCLANFSLRGCEQALEQLITYLGHLTELELCVDVSKSHESTSKSRIESLVPLSYKAMTSMCNSFHGDLFFILKTVMKSLLPNLLMTGSSTFVTSSTVIPRCLVVMKDRTILFILSLMNECEDIGQEAVRILIQHMCIKVTDKSEYRIKVAQVVATLISSLNEEYFFKIGKWLLRFMSNSKVAYRMFGLELINYLLNNNSLSKYNVNMGKDSEFSTEALISCMLRRCSDKSATVRAKALSMLAGCCVSDDKNLCTGMKNLLLKQSLTEIDSINHNEIEKEINAENASDKKSDDASDSVITVQRKEINLTECDDDEVSRLKVINLQKTTKQLFPPPEETIEMLKKRIYDDKVAVRKAAIQVIENIICLNAQQFEKEDIVTLRKHCMDPALLVRKQALISITAVLELLPSNDDVQKEWIQGVLPLVFDKETSIQQRCYELIEKILLNPICEKTSDSPELVDAAWKILCSISLSHNQDNQRYLQKACQEWAKSGNVKPLMLSSLKNQVSGPYDSAVWFLLSSLAMGLEIKDPKFIIDYWKKCCDSDKIEGSTLQRLIQVIGLVSSKIKEKDSNSVIDDLKQQLYSFSSPPELIAVMLYTFTKLCQNLKSIENSKKVVEDFFTKLLIASDNYLSSIILSQNSVKDEDELIVRHLFTLGEVCQLCPEQIPRRVFLLIQSLIATPCITNPAPEKYGLTSSQMSQPSQQPLSQLSGSLINPKIRAHAFITLGKLCLQNEDIAKKSVAAMGRELSETTDATIRNNIVVILSDLCVRYTILVDPYMPNITACLKDPSQLVRRQTLILLIKLLQEDYIKWKGIMFYQLLTVLVDENLQMREFAEYCFTSLLLPKQPLMMYHHFVESIFHFNTYKEHESYNKFKMSEREVKLFNLSGQENKKNRNLIYRFMLESMSDEHKFFLTQKICQDILSAASDGSLNLTNNGASVLHDAFTILYSEEIKLSSLKGTSQEQVDEADMAAVLVATAKKTLITQVVRKNVIENIVPIVVSLKHMLEKQKSPMLKELMKYLKELMKDYRNEVKDIMSSDKQLAKEIEYDLQRFDKEQAEAEINNEVNETNQPRPVESEGTPIRLNLSSTPKTPRNSRAILQSAKILIESAKREMAGRLESSNQKDSARKIGSEKLAAFRSFHTPKSSHPITPVGKVPLTEYCFRKKDAYFERLQITPLTSTGNIHNNEDAEPEINKAPPKANDYTEIIEVSNLENTGQNIMNKILNNSSVLKVCLARCDDSMTALPAIKEENVSGVSVQNENDKQLKSTLLSEKVIENVENLNIKEEQQSNSKQRKSSRTNKYRAVSTPTAKSSNLSNISFAQNISAIDFPTPIVPQVRSSKRRKK